MTIVADLFMPPAFGEFLMAADKISMQMCFDHVFNLKSICLGLREVFVNVTLRIYHDGFAIRSD